MFCGNCGKQLPDGQRFCPDCGASLAPQQEQPVQPPVYQQPVYQQPVYQQPVYQQPVYQQPAQPQYQQPDTFQLGTAPAPKKAKKSKKGLFIGLGVGLAVAAAAVAVALNFDAIRSFFGGEKALADMGTPQEQVEYLYGGALNSLTDTLTKTVNPAENAEDMRVDGELKLRFDESVLSGFGMAANMDMDWAKELTMTLTVQEKGGLGQVLLGAGLGGNTQINLDAIVEIEQPGKVWYGLPGLNRNYLEVDLEQLSQMGGVVVTSSMSTLNLLPDSETLAESLAAYTDIILSYLQDAESYTETVECGGLEQELTVLKIKVTEKQLAQMLKEVLQYARKDASIKEFFENYNESLRQQYLSYGFTQEDIDLYIPDMYEEFDDSVLDVLDDLEDVLINAQKGNYLYIYNYVDVADVVGMKLEVHSVGESTQEFSFLTVWEDDEFAFLGDFMTLQITGEGFREKGIVEGEYIVEVEGEEALILEVEGYDQNAAKENKLIGTFTFRPAPGLANMAASGSNSSAASVLSMMAVRVNLDCSEEKSAGSVEFLAASTELITLEFSFTRSEPGKIKAPSNVVVFDGYQDSLMDWVDDIDFDSLLDALEDAGMPDELIDALENSLYPVAMER